MSLDRVFGCRSLRVISRSLRRPWRCASRSSSPPSATPTSTSGKLRYIPLLKETFTFPQSLGILGGKPGTSTYIAGVQDDRAIYLDPHDVQMELEVEKFITHSVPFSEINKAFDLMHKGEGIRCIIRMEN